MFGEFGGQKWSFHYNVLAKGAFFSTRIFIILKFFGMFLILVLLSRFVLKLGLVFYVVVLFRYFDVLLCSSHTAIILICNDRFC